MRQVEICVPELCCHNMHVCDADLKRTPFVIVLSFCKINISSVMKPGHAIPV